MSSDKRQIRHVDESLFTVHLVHERRVRFKVHEQLAVCLLYARSGAQVKSKRGCDSAACFRFELSTEMATSCNDLDDS